MSRLTMANTLLESVVAEYEAASTFTGTTGYKHEISAFVRLRLNGVDGSDEWLILDIEDVRYLAEVLPDLLMTHDAAEHAAAERAAAEDGMAPAIRDGLVDVWCIDPKGGVEFGPASDSAAESKVA